MVENKWQHFVPQFYFKFFSEDDKNIGIFNLKRQSHFKGAFENQSAKNFFYSENVEIEKSFSPLEGKFKDVLKRLILDGFKQLDSRDYFEVLRFITFQFDRTELSKKASKDYTQKFVENVMKPMMKANKELREKLSPEDIDNVKITHPADFLYSVLLSLEANILLTDLVPVLIKNKTEADFIFSDNPIIKYNGIYYSEGHSFTGYQSPGLLVFFPLNPKLMIMLFDPVYYNIKLEQNNEFSLNDLEDVSKLNKFQFHNCMKNVYYSDKKSKKGIDLISEEFFSEYSKGENLAQMREIPNWRGNGNSLLVSSRKSISERIKFNFLKYASPKQTIATFRDKKLCDLFNEKIKAIEEMMELKKSKKKN
ncbi:MAG: DUF4238 domain-containing protein [Candidatus Pacearchaeota archaeon]